MFHSWSGKTVPQRDRHVPSCRSPVRTYKTGGAPLSTWPPIPMKSRGSWPSTSEGLKSFHPTPWPSPGCMPPGRAIIHMPARDRLRCRHFGHGRQIRQTGAKLHLFEEGHQFLIQDREADYGTIIDHLKSYPGQPVAGTCVSGTISSAFATIYAPGGNIAHQIRPRLSQSSVGRS